MVEVNSNTKFAFKKSQSNEIDALIIMQFYQTTSNVISPAEREIHNVCGEWAQCLSVDNALLTGCILHLQQWASVELIGQKIL